MKLRVLAFALAILVFFVFVGSPFQQAVNAVPIVGDAIIAVIIVALAAFGITFTFTGGYYTVYDFISDMISESGVDFTGYKLAVNSSGNLLLNNRFITSVSTLAAYIKATLSLTDNSTKTIYTPTDAVQDELTGNYYNVGRYYGTNNATAGTILFSFQIPASSNLNTDYYYRFDGQYYRFNVSVDTSSRSFNVNGYAGSDLDNMTGPTQMLTGTYGAAWASRDYNFSIAEDNNGAVWLLLWSVSGSVSAATMLSVYQLNAVTVGVDLSAKTGVIDIPDGVEIGDDGAIISLPVPWGSTLPDVIDEVPDLTESGELEGNVTITLTDEGDVTDQIDQAATDAISVSNNPSDYQTPGLQSVFPFCIPFDLYNFVGCLAADPVAPSFTWRFYVPGICDESIEIDLSEFDAAAQILRTMELLLFCVGLAFVTRKIIRG